MQRCLILLSFMLTQPVGASTAGVCHDGTRCEATTSASLLQAKAKVMKVFAHATGESGASASAVAQKAQAYKEGLKALNEVILRVLQKESGDFDSAIADLNRIVTMAAAGDAIEGKSDDVPTEQNQYKVWASQLKEDQVVCETGFNGGHSALVFLALSKARVYEFDLGSHTYGKAAQTFLDESYPARLHVTWGDSTKTLPSFATANPNVKCNMIIVDGGHSDDVAMSDLVSFAKMAAPGHVLAIDDTPCSAGWCDGPTRQWQELEKEGCVQADAKVKMGADRGFTYGRYTPCTRWPDMK